MSHICKKWNDEEISILKKFYRLYDINKLCLLLNRSEASIFQKAFRLKLKRKFYSSLDKESLIEEYIVNRKAITKIAKKYGISSASVYKKMLKYDIKTDKPSSFGKNHATWKGVGDLSGQYFGCIIKGAKSRNLDFSITIEQIWKLFLKQNRKCALTGVKLYFKRHVKTKCIIGTASLDRIDSSKGYTIDNVQWIHKDINQMKMNFSEEKFLKWCKLIINYNQNKNKLNTEKVL